MINITPRTESTVTTYRTTVLLSGGDYAVAVFYDMRDALAFIAMHDGDASSVQIVKRVRK